MHLFLTFSFLYHLYSVVKTVFLKSKLELNEEEGAAMHELHDDWGKKNQLQRLKV